MFLSYFRLVLPLLSLIDDFINMPAGLYLRNRLSLSSSIARAIAFRKRCVKSGCSYRSESLWGCVYIYITILCQWQKEWKQHERRPSWWHRPACPRQSRRSVSLCRVTTNDVIPLFNPWIPPSFPIREQHQAE